MGAFRLDHSVIAVSDWDSANRFYVDVETGPVPRFGSRGEGVSVYFRDPDGSLLEFISYDEAG